MLLALYAPLSYADCACLWRGSFVDVHPEADLVLTGAVSDGRGNSIDIDISRVLRGPDYLQEVRVWLQARDYCRPERELFPVGSTWVMALQRIDSVPEDGFDPNTPDISYGRKGDYLLSSCGGYWLKLSGNVVSGALVKSPRWAREPEMTPVLLDLIDAHVNGRIGDDAVLEASQEDPRVKELILDTKEFLRSIQR
ncbi:hypothetical protein EV688_12040 [Chromatocurvus halotolerans]|uniref:Uncharacterized protein n=2 Tax=Chromatocurvus halotolerans TaxID=1132028 RepID=A0A4R2KMD0_9GAMM|nr:hypothetical protein EV688_12040 [Chromatocurvus halotolerans]